MALLAFETARLSIGMQREIYELVSYRNSMLKWGFGSKRDETTEGWTKLHNLEVVNYDMIYLLTAIGLTPGGSSTVHIYTETIH